MRNQRLITDLLLNLGAGLALPYDNFVLQALGKVSTARTKKMTLIDSSSMGSKLCVRRAGHTFEKVHHVVKVSALAQGSNRKRPVHCLCD